VVVTEEALGASRDPAREREMREMRLFIVVREDIDLTREQLMSLSARGCCEAMLNAADLDPDRHAAYDPRVQPKIGKRARNEGSLRRMLDEAIASGLPAIAVDAAPGILGAVVIGPACRAELPKYVEKAQILGERPKDASVPLPEDELPGPSAPAIWLLLRGDLDIPWGKLVAQAGHGALGAMLAGGDASVTDWRAAGRPVRSRAVTDVAAMEAASVACRAAGIPEAFILDAGRTCFDGPTPTLVGVGPCTEAELDAALNPPGPSPR